MEFIITLLILALAIWIWYLFSREFYRIAVHKGFEEKKYLWLTFWFGLIGILLVIALPDHSVRNVNMPAATAPAAKTAFVSNELPDL